jgi:6-phospho-beta-glucosidase
MEGLKITIIGGGSSYTPEIIEGFIKRSKELPVREIYLVDIKEGEGKLNIVGELAQRMMKKAGLNTKIIMTLDRRAAIKNADFVTTQFRVGGLEARDKDETFPLKYNVLGQETTGPGGFAKAMRTIPVIMDICEDIEELSPNAWLINFTNPAGLVTEAVNRYTKVKALGLCNVPITMVNTMAKILETDSKDILVDFAGLNHLVWARKVYNRGKDITKVMIEKMFDNNHLNMKNIPDLKWDKDYIKALGMIPCPYHRYYYMNDRLVEEEKRALEPGGKGTRAQQVMKIEKRLFEIYKDKNLEDKPKELEGRGGAYYSDAAVSLISAIYNNKQEIHVVNVRNNGTIWGLDEDAVIEANCIIDKSGAKPIHVGKLPLEIIGLIGKVKAYETLAVQSGVTGDINKALLSLSMHPLIPSVETAKKLLIELIDINKGYLPQFEGKEFN